jgi:hypothetical protein
MRDDMAQNMFKGVEEVDGEENDFDPEAEVTSETTEEETGE